MQSQIRSPPSHWLHHRDSCGSGGRVSRPLITLWAVWSPAPPVHMLKLLWICRSSHMIAYRHRYACEWVNGPLCPLLQGVIDKTKHPYSVLLILSRLHILRRNLDTMSKQGKHSCFPNTALFNCNLVTRARKTQSWPLLACTGTITCTLGVLTISSYSMIIMIFKNEIYMS